MVRRISSAQLRSQLRQIQQKQRNAVNRYNHAVKAHNQNVNRAINKHNQEVRNHNARNLSNRRKLQTALRQFEVHSASIQSRHVSFRTSVATLHQKYDHFVEHSAREYEGTPLEYVVDLVESENTNSLETMNSLAEDEKETDEDPQVLQHTAISNELITISPELDARWQGAMFSLNPKNPDAARHFCTSAREIFTEILETRAPNEEVLSSLPTCERTAQGGPTRRARIQYILNLRNMNDRYLEDFVDSDMNNIIELFRDFNNGTHGSAGKYSLQQLLSIKTRVEGGIIFLSRLVS